MTGVRLAADENLDDRLVRALRRRIPSIDVVRVRDAGLGGATDAQVLEWAAEDGRILVTRDVRTVPAPAFQRLEAGRRMPGVLVVPAGSPSGPVVSDLALIAEVSDAEEWTGRVTFLPLS